MRLLRTLLVLGGFLPTAALAQINPCPLGSIIPCSGVYGPGAAGFNRFLDTEIFLELRVAFAGVMLIFGLYYAVRLMAESGDESTISEVKQAYGYAVSGAFLVSMAGLVVVGVGNDASTTLINSQAGGPLSTIFETLITYGKWVLGVLVMIFIAFQGVRLVILANQEAETEKQKKRFFNGLVGVAVVLLASAIGGAFSNSNASLLGNEGKALANFALEVFGFLVIISFVMSGLFMVVSTDEALKDRAKKAFFASVVGLVTVFSCYMIVTYVLSV